MRLSSCLSSCVCMARDTTTPPSPHRRKLTPPTDAQEWVLERYEGAPVELVGPHRKYLELETSCADDDDQPFVTPTVIYRWAH